MQLLLLLPEKTARTTKINTGRPKIKGRENTKVILYMRSCETVIAEVNNVQESLIHLRLA
jgi:hypothetical protein